jgi:zinc/manganese transport system substrate-binding protein
MTGSNVARIRRALGVFAFGLAAFVALSGCAGSPATPGGRVNIVAGENFWGDIARQIGGDRVLVTSIISDPNADPHLYESSASNAAAVAQARIVIVNGLGYDDFMDRLIAGSGAHPEIVSAQAALGVTDPTANPHLWYDVPRVHLVAQAIEEALVRSDPAGEKVYAANLAKFDSSLQPVLGVIARIKAEHPGAQVAYTERVAAYLLSAAGLQVVSPPGFAKAVEDGTDPSPADAQAMQAVIATKRARLLVYNTQAMSALTRRVLADAKAAGVPVVGVTETMPPQFGSYQPWQLDQATRILRALGG